MKKVRIEIDFVVGEDGKIYLPPYCEIEKEALRVISGDAQGKELAIDMESQATEVQERSLFPMTETVTKKSDWEKRSAKWREYAVPLKTLSKKERDLFVALRDCPWIFCIFQKTAGAKFSLGKLLTKASIDNGWRMTRDSNGHAYCYSREAYIWLQKKLESNDAEIRFLDKYRITYSVGVA